LIKKYYLHKNTTVRYEIISIFGKVDRRFNEFKNLMKYFEKKYPLYICPKLCIEDYNINNYEEDLHTRERIEIRRNHLECILNILILDPVMRIGKNLYLK